MKLPDWLTLAQAIAIEHALAAGGSVRLVSTRQVVVDLHTCAGHGTDEQQTLRDTLVAAGWGVTCDPPFWLPRHDPPPVSYKATIWCDKSLSAVRLPNRILTITNVTIACLALALAPSLAAGDGLPTVRGHWQLEIDVQEGCAELPERCRPFTDVVLSAVDGQPNWTTVSWSEPGRCIAASDPTDRIECTTDDGRSHTVRLFKIQNVIYVRRETIRDGGITWETIGTYRAVPHRTRRAPR